MKKVAPLHAALIKLTFQKFLQSCQLCRNFWNACIPLNVIEFAVWCSQFPVPVSSTNNEPPAELVSFSLDIISPIGNHAPTPLNDCTVKSLTAYFTANRAGPIDLGNITGLVGWARHWPMYANKFRWNEYFHLLNNNSIDKITRTSFLETPPPKPYPNEQKAICSL